MLLADDTKQVNIKELTKNIEQWFFDRGLESADPKKQWLKLMEEFGELCSGIAKQKEDVIKDSVGDMYVVLVGLCVQTGVDSNELRDYKPAVPEMVSKDVFEAVSRMAYSAACLSNHKEVLFVGNLKHVCFELKQFCDFYNIDFAKCVQLAYDEIKDRKGKMIGGVFVKEEDLRR